MYITANGGCRSEGVVSFFLQKAKDAKRNYATVVTVTSDCLGLRACSLINFDNLLSERLLNFYKNNNIDPDEIAYLEADGSGFKVSLAVFTTETPYILGVYGNLLIIFGSNGLSLGNAESSLSQVIFFSGKLSITCYELYMSTTRCGRYISNVSNTHRSH